MKKALLAALAALIPLSAAAAGAGRAYFPRAEVKQVAALQAALGVLGQDWMKAQKGDLPGLAGSADPKNYALIASWLSPHHIALLETYSAQGLKAELAHVVLRAAHSADLESVPRLWRLQDDIKYGRVPVEVLGDVDAFSREYLAVYGPYLPAGSLDEVLRDLKARANEARAQKVTRALEAIAEALVVDGREQMWGYPYQLWSDGREPADRVAARHAPALRAALAAQDKKAFAAAVAAAFQDLESELRAEGLDFIGDYQSDDNVIWQLKEQAMDLETLIGRLEAEYGAAADGASTRARSRLWALIEEKETEFGDLKPRLEEGAPFDSFYAVLKRDPETGPKAIEHFNRIAGHYRELLQLGRSAPQSGALAEIKRRIELGHYTGNTLTRVKEAWEDATKTALPSARRRLEVLEGAVALSVLLGVFGFVGAPIFALAMDPVTGLFTGLLVAGIVGGAFLMMRVERLRESLELFRKTDLDRLA